jgi:hypothetical protein
MGMTTTKTTTQYQIEGHDYLISQGGRTRCANPQTCSVKSHWSEQAVVDTKAEIKDWTGENNDAPAVRVNKLTVTIVSERIEI